MSKTSLNNQGFAKLILMILGGIVFFLVVMVVADEIMAPPDKKFFTPPGSSSSSQTNTGNSQPVDAATNYKNSLTLNWIETNKVPSLQSYITPEGGKVYVAQDINYCTSRDQKLLLDLYSNKQPSPSGLQPMVVYLHGGGMMEGDKTQIDADMAKVILSMVENGFIVASVNYQLAPTFKFPAQIQDVLCAMRFMKYYAYGIGGNQNKIGILGDSVGGQLSSLAGVTSGIEPWENSGDLHITGANLTNEEYLKIPTKPNATADFYGSTQLPESPIALSLMRFMGSWHDPFTGQDRPLAEMMKEIYPDSTAMHEGSAMNYVTAGKPPFLIVQGDKDKLNSENLSVDFYNKLKSNNNNVTLLIVKNAEHGLIPSPQGAVMDPSLDSIVNTTVDFFKSHLE